MCQVHAAGSKRLVTASARNFAQNDIGPSRRSFSSGSYSSDAAKRRGLPTEKMPLHRCANASLTASATGARVGASKNTNAAASSTNLSPTSTPNTARRQRRARSSSGWVWLRLRAAAWASAWQAASAPGCLAARKPCDHSWPPFLPQPGTQMCRPKQVHRDKRRGKSSISNIIKLLTLAPMDQ